MKVRAKKHLGQHFLTDENITRKIANTILHINCRTLIEIGPGTGVLTKYLLEKHSNFKAIEIDTESIGYLHEHYPNLEIIKGDFLKLNPELYITSNTAIVGNFPYNISSQIFFKVLDNRNKIDTVVGMIQKEVAERIAEKEGNKNYGILSILLQTYYNVEYLFTVNENVFMPPPKVKSAVVRLTRNERTHLHCDEKLFIQIIKESFGQRRKMIRSSLKKHILHIKDHRFLTMRPEQLSIENFIELTNLINPPKA